MIKIFFPTEIRGFFKHLFDENDINASIGYKKKAVYEVGSWKSNLIKSIARLTIFDKLGLIYSVKAIGEQCDYYGSFNRFLVADKPYFIYIENPTALYHYCLNRGKSRLGKRHIRRYLDDTNLKALICMSKACFMTFSNVCAPPRKDSILTQIYPLIPDNPYVNENYINDRCKNNDIKLLYIAQGIRFLSKGALEVLEAFRNMKSNGLNVSLTMVTSFKDVDQTALHAARNEDGVKVHDFEFTYDEMQKLYASHNILLIPTSDDSFNLTVLEAMKAGLPVIGSSLYAIPEMVHDNENGFLCEPAWYFFDKNNVPNPTVWNHRKETIYSGILNKRVANYIYNKASLLVKDRELLLKMSLDSWKKSTSAPFSRDYIVRQWNELLNSMGEI